MDNKCFIIAEAGSNFDGRIDQAYELIDVAAAAGADAVKFQMFKAKVLYPDKSQPVHDIVRKNELPRSWVPDLISRCNSVGIEFMCSPFDLEALDILVSQGVKKIKIGSSETVNLKLLRAAARSGAELFISTGTCSMSDIADAVEVVTANGCEMPNLLHCYSVYPTDASDTNLKIIETLKHAFQLPVGFSDHSFGTAIPVAAVALGINCLEKHFTLSRDLKGPDHSYALEPDELKLMISQIREVEQAMGVGKKGLHPDEFRWNRRDGVHLVSKINAGERLQPEHLEIRRPASPVEPRFMSTMYGCQALRDIEKGAPLAWDDFSS